MSEFDEDKLNMGIRKFLKQVGVTSQREIETAVREAIDGGKLSPGARLHAKCTLEVPELGILHVVEQDLTAG